MMLLKVLASALNRDLELVFRLYGAVGHEDAVELEEACLVEGLEDRLRIGCHTGEKAKAVHLTLAHEGAVIPLVA